MSPFKATTATLKNTITSPTVRWMMAIAQSDGVFRGDGYAYIYHSMYSILLICTETGASLTLWLFFSLASSCTTRLFFLFHNITNRYFPRSSIGFSPVLLSAGECVWLYESKLSTVCIDVDSNNPMLFLLKGVPRSEKNA